jgi:hypothetical protein
MTRQYERGDIVRHRSAFLQSIGWVTDVPVNGVVVDRTNEGNVLKVWWSDCYTGKILSTNVEPCPKAARERGVECANIPALVAEFLNAPEVTP